MSKLGSREIRDAFRAGVAVGLRDSNESAFLATHLAEEFSDVTIRLDGQGDAYNQTTRHLALCYRMGVCAGAQYSRELSSSCLEKAKEGGGEEKL